MGCACAGSSVFRGVGVGVLNVQIIITMIAIIIVIIIIIIILTMETTTKVDIFMKRLFKIFAEHFLPASSESA